MSADDVEKLAIAMFEAGRAFCGEGAEDWQWEDAEQEGMRVYARVQLAASAAGPWRTDVENAPRDVRLLASWGGDMFEPAEHRKNKAGYFVWFVNDIETPAPIAFAVPNPPQVTP